MKGLITDIQRFSLNDGPGIRTTVFFKGCNMHCSWCHNPETINKSKEICIYQKNCIECGRCFSVCPTNAHKIKSGQRVFDRDLCIICGKCTDVCYAQALVTSGKEMTIDEIMGEILQDKLYYDNSDGGVTLSGGEVLCQHDFALELTRACHKENIKVAIETNLSFQLDEIKPLLDEIDLIMADIKLLDSASHKKFTGISSETILNNIKSIVNKPMIIRTPLIPNATATKENLIGIAKFLEGKKNVLFYQLLNFNPLGETKYKSLSKTNAFENKRPYTQNQLNEFKDALSGINISIKVGE